MTIPFHTTPWLASVMPTCPGTTQNSKGQPSIQFVNFLFVYFTKLLKNELSIATMTFLDKLVKKYSLPSTCA